jgi:2-polyprenyl-6-methoxyphenol hydroxylase-like FAD-dependent oxidoreductase
VGDVLVGADGAASRVRRHYLPHVRPIDAGAVSVAHKIWLTDEVRAALPRLGTGMNIVNVNAPCFLFTSAFEPPGGASRPYLLCALVTRPDVLPPDLTELDGDGLRAAVDVLVAGWHPQLRRALAESDPESRNAIAFRAAEPGPPWPSTSVTLFGDAIHLMPPIGGLGGNTALRDAHLLTRLLTAAGASRTRWRRSGSTSPTCGSTGRQPSDPRWLRRSRPCPTASWRRPVHAPGSGCAPRYPHCGGAPSARAMRAPQPPARGSANWP